MARNGDILFEKKKEEPVYVALKKALAQNTSFLPLQKFSD
jgi:hypothetical protein